MAGTPIEAMIAHLATFETLDDAAFATSLAFPFTHLYPDGELNRWEGPADVSVDRDIAKFGLERATYGRITLDRCDLVLDLARVKVFRIEATRYAAGTATATSRGEAVWVLLEEAGAWRVKLRVGPGALPLKG